MELMKELMKSKDNKNEMENNLVQIIQVIKLCDEAKESHEILVIFHSLKVSLKSRINGLNQKGQLLMVLFRMCRYGYLKLDSKLPTLLLKVSHKRLL